MEILVDGQWGTVCGNNFDNRAATVVCRQLGFEGSVGVVGVVVVMVVVVVLVLWW